MKKSYFVVDFFSKISPKIEYLTQKEVGMTNESEQLEKGAKSLAGNKIQVLNKSNVIVHKDDYKEEYDLIAFKSLKNKSMSLSHVCVALKRPRTTIQRWIEKHQSFRQAIEQAKEISESKFVEKMEEYAWQPQMKINTGLVKLIAKSAYNIDGGESQVIINNNQQNNVTTSESSQLYDDALKDK